VEYTGGLYNDPGLCDHARKIFAHVVGPANVLTLPPTTGGEDFSVYIDTLGVPGLMFSVGAVEPRAAARARRGKPAVPLHNSRFAPLPEPTLKTAIRSMCALVGSLLKEGK
jgi:hippurate hydrolase